MADRNSHKGPWTHRFLLHLFTVILGVLIYWLLGFVIHDIDRLQGPSYYDFESQRLDQGLVGEAKELESQIAQVERQTSDQQKRQNILRDSTDNSQKTMNQLLEFQRLSLQKGVTPSTEEQKALAESQQLFLTNQKQYQLLNDQIAQLNEQLRDLQEKKRTVEKTLEQRREPIRRQFDSVHRRHELKLAGLKLAVLIPLLLVAVFLFLKQRSSIYARLIYAFGIALLLRVTLVLHEHFPRPYFRYLLLVVALAIVLRILVQLLRTMAYPKKSWLLGQYREAYEAFVCPICDYPIRRGPLKYMFWSRRSLKKLRFPPTTATDADQPYTCPMCATTLYEECPACHAIRHSLLPACQSCGATKPIGDVPGTRADDSASGAATA